MAEPTKKTIAPDPEKLRRAKETLKTILIVTLLVGVAAFIGGIKYQQHQDQQSKVEVQKYIDSLKK